MEDDALHALDGLDLREEPLRDRLLRDDERMAVVARRPGNRGVTEFYRGRVDAVVVDPEPVEDHELRDLLLCRVPVEERPEFGPHRTANVWKDTRALNGTAFQCIINSVDEHKIYLVRRKYT